MCIVTLLAVVLVLAGLRGPCSHAAPGQPPHRAGHEPAVAANVPKALPWKVTGYGRTKEDARDVALEQAIEQVKEYFANQNPPIELPERVPGATGQSEIALKDYITQNLVKDGPEEAPRQLAGGEVQVVTLIVEVGPKLKEIERLDRHYRMERRQWLLGVVLGGLVVVLVVVALYFRLEEYTKGYYTVWLRAIGLGLIALAGIGVWWLW
jgi:hypothetical protein